MPRPRRVHIEEGALYLISSKAAEGKRLFLDREDYEAYLALLEGYRQKFRFALFGYTLLPGELHLCMQMKGGVTASSVMHALNSRYTKFYMKRHGRSGHLFEGRFKSTLLEKEPYLLRVTGYLHALVEHAEGSNAKAYPWSSYRSYLNGEGSSLQIGSEMQEVLKALQSEWPGISYPDYLQSVPNFRWEEFGKELEELALGSQAFLSLVEKKAKGQVTVTPPHTQGDSHRDPKEPHPQPGPMPEPERVTVTKGDSHPAQGTRRLHSVALMASVLATCLALGGIGLTLKQVTVTGGDSHLDQLAAAGQGEVARAHSLARFAVPTGLDGTSWEVWMKPMYATGNGQPQRDEIEFHASRVASAKLTAEGFSDSKYTVTQKPNGTVRWETMQRGPAGERVFWRGEWDGKMMRGVVSRQVPGSGSLDFSFAGVKQGSKETGRTL